MHPAATSLVKESLYLQVVEDRVLFQPRVALLLLFVFVLLAHVHLTI